MHILFYPGILLLEIFPTIKLTNKNIHVRMCTGVIKGLEITFRFIIKELFNK